MNMMTSVHATPGAIPAAPIALFRALPPGPLAAEYQRLKRLADLFAAFDRDEMEAAVELLLAELDARDGDIDLEDSECGMTCVDYRGHHLNVEMLASLPTEDDEPNADDEPDADAEPMLGAAEHGACGTVWSNHHRDQDDDEREEDPAPRDHRHRDRVRRERCRPVILGGYVEGYKLIERAL